MKTPFAIFLIISAFAAVWCLFLGYVAAAIAFDIAAVAAFIFWHREDYKDR